MNTSNFTVVVCTLAASLLGVASPVLGQASFHGLGDLPGGSFSSSAYGVSHDGSEVAGDGTSESGAEAFRWTSTDGTEGAGVMVGLSDLPGGWAFFSSPRAISADGSTVVGVSVSGNGIEAFRWTQETGMVGLNDLPGGAFDSGALGVSGDGSVVVGESKSASGTEAFRWTSGGMEGLHDLPGGGFYSSANAVSVNGTIIVGESESGLGTEGFLWTQAGGMTPLGDLDGGAFHSGATGVSADGSILAGYGTSASGTEACRWDSNGIAGLGDLAGGGFYSVSTGVSANGSFIVGRSKSGLGEEAFLWDSVNGMRNLKAVLVDEFGLDLTGWTLTGAEDISSDGLSIVGYGTNPAGQQEAWIAHIPEPASLGLLSLGGLMLLKRKRRA